jgi:FkbM family methyltransferase
MNTKIAIYGAGQFGKIFASALEYKIDFFIDDFTNQSTYLDKSIKKITEIDKDTLIYISVLQYSKKIENTLIKNGFVNVITFTESIKILPNILFLISKTNYLWLVEDKDKMTNNEKLDELRDILSDQKSKNILNKLINLRETLDTKYYIDPSDTEYFPSDIPILDNLNDINFIDCGAYTGDTIEELMKQSDNVKTTISFEPDSKNLESLEKNFTLLSEKNKETNFFIYPAGVYSSNKILKFSNNGIASSASLVDSSNIQVPVVSLDTVILNSDPNFIKMDIEGAEKEALLGAEKTIKKHKPNLAICLYHKPEDLWELPLLINKIEPSYEMYIRVHEDMCLSTVLYCISKEKYDV